MSTFREYFDTLFRNGELDPSEATITMKNDKHMLYGFKINIYKDSYEYKVPFVESEIKEGTKACIVTYRNYIYLIFNNNKWGKEL